MIAAATYGEETYLPGMPWDVGTCTDGVGVSKRSHLPTFPSPIILRVDIDTDTGLAKLYPRLHPEWCDPYAASLREYCDEGDMECCISLAVPNFSHFLYIFKYNMDLLHYIQRRLNETRSQ